MTDRNPTDGPRHAAGPADDESGDVARRLAGVHEQIRAAAESVGRRPQAITLVAVSKKIPMARLSAAISAGHVDFGESRAQELTRKAADVGKGVRWHFVGRLQRNKVADVIDVASLIHSVDRMELAEAVAARASTSGGVQRVLLQVNTAGDPNKAGVEPDGAIATIAKIRELPGIACEGLMTIPKLGEDPRPAFAALRGLRDEARERFPEVQHLSMGMTADLDAAVAEGATIVRVGEGVFGPRQST